MKPIVGIFAEVDGNLVTSVRRPYVSAIEQAGGVPLLLPYVENDKILEEMIGACDGILFTGGKDIDPERYGEGKKPTCDEIQPNCWEFEYSHDVNVKKNTYLYELFGAERVKANSFHHQALKELGEGLKVMADADDGIVEAVYYSGNQYIRAYQWHPERLFDKDENNRRVFEDFISNCK